jgi:outer membrane protein assembly factor BamB
MKIKVLIVAIVLLITACSKEKVPEETLWGLHHEPVVAIKLPADSGSKELKKLWISNIGGGASHGYAQLKPAFYEGSLFIVNRGGDVYRKESRSGDVLWKVELDKSVNNAVGIGDSILVVSYDSGVVTALNTRDGSIAWETEIKRNISAIPTVGMGRVIVRTSDGLVIGLDAKTGDRAWQVKKEVPELSIQGDSQPVITGDAVLVGLSNGNMIANNVISGRDYWEAELSFVQGKNELERMNDSDSTPIVQGTTVYAATYQGNVVASQLQNAATVWRTDLSTSLPMALQENMLVITGETGEIISLSTIDGSLNWTQSSFTGHGVSHPAIVSNRIVIGDAIGNLHTLDLTTGALIETKKVAKGAILGLVTNGDIISAFTSEGELVTYSL